MRNALKVLAISMVALALGTASAHADELTPQARLRKLSLQSRGLVPLESEYAALASTAPDQREDFFAKKARAYYYSDLAADKLSDRLFEMLRFDLPEQSLFLKDETYRKASAAGVDLALGFDKSMTSLKSVLARQIAAGKSWDEILTSKEVLFLPIAGQALSEFSQSAQAISDQLAKLKDQGVAVDSLQDKVVAIKMLTGAVALPTGVKITIGVDTSIADDLPRATRY